LKKEGYSPYSKQHRKRQGLVQTLQKILREKNLTEIQYVYRNFNILESPYDTYYKRITASPDPTAWLGSYVVIDVLVGITKPNWSYLQNKYLLRVDEELEANSAAQQIIDLNRFMNGVQLSSRAQKRFKRKSRVGTVIHINRNHYTCFYIDLKKRTAIYHDSFGNDPFKSNTEHNKALSKWVRYTLDKCNIPFERLQVNTHKMQHGGNQCGMFCIYVLQQLAQRKPIDYNKRDKDMREMRDNYLHYLPEYEETMAAQRRNRAKSTKVEVKEDDQGRILLDSSSDEED
jgi:hypothetical protein